MAKRKNLLESGALFTNQEETEDTAPASKKNLKKVKKEPDRVYSFVIADKHLKFIRDLAYTKRWSIKKTLGVIVESYMTEWFKTHKESDLMDCDVSDID